MAYEYDPRTITHGDAFGLYFTINPEAETKADVYATGKSFTGLRAIEAEVSQDQTTLYADNITHMTLNGNATTTVTITGYQISQDFLTKHLGKFLTENGMLTDTGVYGAFGFAYLDTVSDEFGQDKRQLKLFYNLKASAPTESDATDEDAITPIEFEIACGATPSKWSTANNKQVTFAQVIESAETAWIFESVIDNQIMVFPDDSAPQAV